MVMTKNSFNNSVSGLIQPYSTRTQMRLMSCTWLFSYFSTFLFTAMANTNLYKRVNPSGQLFSNDTSCPFPISTASCTFTISGAIRPATTLTKSTGWLYGSRGAMQVRRFRILSLSLASEVMCDGFSLSWLVTRPVTKGGEVPLEKLSPPPWKNVLDIAWNYWTKFKKFGPLSENSSPWCPKLVTGLLVTSLSPLWSNMFAISWTILLQVSALHAHRLMVSGFGVMLMISFGPIP